MSLEFELPLVSFIFIVMLIIVYYSKKNLKLIENKYFELILVASFFEIIIDTVIHLICAINSFEKIVSNYYYLFNCLNKILIILFLIIFGSFLMYILIISYDKVRKKHIIYRNAFIFIIIIYSLAALFTNIELLSVGNVTNVTGTTILLGYVAIAVTLISSLIVTLLNIKKIDKRYTAIFLIILLLVLLYALTILFPGMIIYDLVLVLLCYIMYFTIENPDMKMLREIQQSKEFAEQANNEKAMFLYNTSQELKAPVNAIHERCEELLQEQDINEIINGIKDIKFATKKLSATISGTLDMNRTQASNIEIKVSKYSTKMLFQEMVSISKLNMKEKTLDFRVKLDDAIPEYLMGDSIRLKQIIQTIMNNAIKHTEKGFIEFNVSSVIKHDVCRLIITIEDSGRGIESKKLETLFYNTEDEGIDEDRLNNVGDTRESLSVVKILTNLIGGTVIVNSELGKGSKFTVVLDQKIAEVKKTSAEIAVESLSSNKRILVVDDEEENLKQIAKLLSKYEVNVDTVEWGQECLEKVRKKQKYDLILLDEDMPRLNGIKTFEKLKLEEDFNVPVIIMITNNHIEYKDRYLYNGFSGCVVKPLNKQQIEKLIKKYIKTGE